MEQMEIPMSSPSVYQADIVPSLKLVCPGVA